jgi:hypothetical protein
LIDPDILTRDYFLSELRERLDALRYEQVVVPPSFDAAVLTIVGGSENPFEQDLFRLAAAHLLDGLDPDILFTEGGVELVTERLSALPANLQLSLRVAAERHEQAV